MNLAIYIKNLTKVYNNQLKALHDINLSVKPGEIFALLGPNGAGKTTLINTVCGIINKTSGIVKIHGYDNIDNYKKARSLVGLVPQELTTDSFETVINTVNFSRGLFGKNKSPKYIKEILENLSLWEKRNSQIRTLSGGMKKRVLIAKALSHEPKVIFLDEPTAGVDVELRKSMWKKVKQLKETGVTIILTTHYIEEAEVIADRIGIIDKGKLILVEEKKKIIEKLGEKDFVINTLETIKVVPKSLLKYNLINDKNRKQLIYKSSSSFKIDQLLSDLNKNKIIIKDLDIKKSTLEDIFVSLVGK